MTTDSDQIGRRKPGKVVRVMLSDQGPAVAGKLLTTELVRLRGRMTQEEVATDLEWSTSKIIRIEGGKTSITKSDLLALLMKYGVNSQEEIGRLQRLSRLSKEPAWWDAYKNDTDPEFLKFVGLEAGASFIRSYQGALVPGLLQTRRYAEAIAEFYVGPVHVGPLVRLRMQRSEELKNRNSPPKRIFVIDEAVVRRHVGIQKDPNIMPEQLRSIAETARSDDLVTVLVIPFKTGAHQGMKGAFTLLEFEGPLGDILFLEGGRWTDQTITGDDSRITDYREAFESMLDETLSARESIDLIISAAEDMS